MSAEWTRLATLPLLTTGPPNRMDACPATVGCSPGEAHFRRLGIEMSISLEEFGIDRLSIDERVALVQAIWDSIAAAPRPPLSEALRAELDRRLADHRENPQDVVPWEDVKAAALARMKQ